MDYKKAGVDIEAGYKSVELMKEHVKKTMRPEVLGGLGGFAGAFDLSGIKNMEEPVLLSGTDGCGTKVKLAFVMDKHDTIGIDAVAMCVNDIACSGGEPLFFLDYIACGKNYPEKIASIVSGVAEGCLQSECALVGGETAEHPGLMPENDYDLAGFAVGVVVIVRAEPVNEIAFGDHVLLQQRLRLQLPHANPLADGAAVIACKVHGGGHIHHIRQRGQLALIVAPELLLVLGARRMDADFIGPNHFASVFVPVLRRYVFFRVDLTVVHKSDHIALFDGVAAGFLAGAGVRNQVELEKIERCLLTDVAGDPHLLLVHNLRVFFEFLGVVFHNEDSFLCFGPKGCFV